MTYLDFLEQKVLLERLVIGLEEPVLIKGLGELSAKIDSGNGGYNVIHGTDFHQQGNELMFTTHDSFGHEKKLQATVIDTIEVNMGGGNIENRPVIELDIKFAGEDYKKIPFSVSDRSTNTNPILISKGFVENELEALIDVGAKNISSDGIDVVYGESVLLDQGIMNNLGKIGSGLMAGPKAAMSGIKNLGTWLGGGKDASLFAPVKGALGAAKDTVKGVVGGAAGLAGDVGKGLVAAGKGLWKITPAVASGLAAIAGGITFAGIKTIGFLSKKITLGPTITKGDFKSIRQKIATTSAWVQILKKAQACGGTLLENERSLAPKNTKPIPIVNFACQKGFITNLKTNNGIIGSMGYVPEIARKKIYVSGQEGRAQAWKKQIANAKKGVDYLKKQKQAAGANNQQDDAQEDEEEILMSLNEAWDILDTEGLLLEDATQQGGETPEGQGQGGTPQESQDGQNGEGENNQEVEEVVTEFESLNMFFLWFIPIASDVAKGEGAIGKSRLMNALRDTNTKSGKVESIDYICDVLLKDKAFDRFYTTLYESGEVTPDKVGNIVKQIVKTIQSAKTPEERKKMSGMFCLAYSPNKKKPEKRDYYFYQQPQYLIYCPDKELDQQPGQETPQEKPLSPEQIQQVAASLQKKFPHVQNATEGFANAVMKEPAKIAQEVVQDKMFQNERGSAEDFKETFAIYGELRKVAQESMAKGGGEQPAITDVQAALGEKGQAFIQAFTKEYTLHSIKNTQGGEQIYSLIEQNPDKVQFNDFNTFITSIAKIPQMKELLMAQQQEEEWISSKLQHFKNKGLM